MKEWNVTFDIKKTCGIPYGQHTVKVEADTAKEAVDKVRADIMEKYDAHAFHAQAKRA
jgi:hypothetical protein